jgi:hypothetical protein
MAESHRFIVYALGPDRRQASERGGSGASRTKYRNQTLDGSPCSHSRASKRSQYKEQSRYRHVPAFREATHPSLRAAVVVSGHPCGWVKVLIRKLCILVDHQAKECNPRKRVGKVKTKETANKAYDAVQVRYGCSNYPGNNPIDRAKRKPHPPSSLGNNGGEMGDLLEDFDINSLHANIKIKN